MRSSTVTVLFPQYIYAQLPAVRRQKKSQPGAGGHQSSVTHVVIRIEILEMHHPRIHAHHVMGQ